MQAGNWLKQARSRLNQAGRLEAGTLEAQVLLAHVIQQPRAWILAHPEFPLGPDQQTELDQLLLRFIDGEPLPYLIGHWEFYGLDFRVTPDVLIPRPETELLVERALDWLKQHPTSRRCADVGCGSGCIAVSLAHHLPGLRILAVDRSRAALRVAQENAARHTAGQIDFFQGDLLSAARGPLDLVCANLPYIPLAALDDFTVTKHEPRTALDGGPDGLAYIRALIGDAYRWLAPGGLLLLEIQYDQGKAVSTLARNAFPGARVEVHPDLAGLPRLVEIEAGGLPASQNE